MAEHHIQIADELMREGTALLVLITEDQVRWMPLMAS
jgi:hypothetical protein